MTVATSVTVATSCNRDALLCTAGRYRVTVIGCFYVTVRLMCDVEAFVHTHVNAVTVTYRRHRHTERVTVT